jgi:hypothetical protein
MTGVDTLAVTAYLHAEISELKRVAVQVPSSDWSILLMDSNFGLDLDPPGLNLTINNPSITINEAPPEKESQVKWKEHVEYGVTMGLAVFFILAVLFWHWFRRPRKSAPSANDVEGGSSAPSSA